MHDTLPALRSSCIRCDGTERLITDDGDPVCLVCVLGWGSYAAIAAGHATDPAPAVTPVVGQDLTVTALLHWSHRVPVVGCPLCGGRV